MFSFTPCKPQNKSAIMQLSGVIRIRWVFIVFGTGFSVITGVVPYIFAGFAGLRCIPMLFLMKGVLL
ncbi:MAG: hypothetical protein FWG03_03110 [Clostridiales bacterium]|nr:hypothetical protein [Clostridiales bacterium]